MLWIAAVSWGIAVALGVVLLTFCAYELRWKIARLRTDLDGLEALGVTATQLLAQADATTTRAARLRERPASTSG